MLRAGRYPAFAAILLSSTAALAQGYYYRQGLRIEPAPQTAPPVSENGGGTTIPRGKLTASFTDPSPQPSVGDTSTLAASATGAKGTVSFALTQGSLPTGLSLSSDGRITGTYAIAGIFSFAVTATDAGGSEPGTVSRTVDVRLQSPQVAVREDRARTVAGTAYRAQAYPTNDSNVARWTLSGPDWLGIGGSDGAITGIPPQGTGTAGFTAIGTDGFGRSGSAAVAIDLEQPSVSASLPSTGIPGDAIVGKLTSNLDAPAYSLQGNPAWLTVAPDGTLGGTVGKDPVGAITGRATQEQASASVAIPFTVGTVAVGLTGNHGGLTGGQALLGAVSATPGSGWRYALSGQPGWMTIDPATGAMAGFAPDADSETAGVTAIATRNGVSIPSDPFAVRVARTSVTLAPEGAIALMEGDATTVAGSTTVADAAWSVSGLPGATVSGAGLATLVTGDVSTVTEFPVTLTATGTRTSASKVATLKVSPATATLAPASVRSGQAFTAALSTGMAAPGRWDASASSADIPGLSASSPTSKTTTLVGTAPVNAGTSPLSRTISANFVATGVPSGVTAASAGADATLTVHPALSLAAATRLDASFGDAVTRQPPAVNGRVGTLSYALLRNGSDISDALGGICAGLSFSRDTGVISGVPTQACDTTQGANTLYSVTDDGGSNPLLAASASGKVDIVVAQATVTASAPAVDATEGGLVSFGATSSIPGASWSVSGNPSWMAFTLSNGSYATSGASPDIDTPYAGDVVLTASKNGASVSRTIPVAIAPASATLGIQGNVRSGAAIAGTVGSTLADGTWTAVATPVSGSGPAFAGLAVEGDALSGVAPTLAGPDKVAYSVVATKTNRLAPASGSVAKASASGTVTVWPAFAFASAPPDRSGEAGVASTWLPPEPVGATDRAAVTYRLVYESGNDASNNLTNYCAGFSFSRATGIISGSANGTCSYRFRYEMTDPGTAGPLPSATVTSDLFRIVATAPRLTVATTLPTAQSGTTITALEGDTIAATVTSNLDNPTWTQAGAGKQAWMTFTPNGSTLALGGVPGNVTADTSYNVTVTATANGASVSTNVRYTVKVATPTFAKPTLTTRALAPFSNAYTMPTANGLGWTVTATDPSASALAGESASATTGTIKGVAAAHVDAVAKTTTVTASNALPGGAIASGTFSLVTYRALTIASPTDTTLFTMSPALASAPNLTGAIGTVTYRLLAGPGGADISNTVGTTCPGLSFNQYGQLTGTPTQPCSLQVAWEATDAANGDANLRKTVTSSGATITIDDRTADKHRALLMGAIDTYNVVATGANPIALAYDRDLAGPVYTMQQLTSANNETARIRQEFHSTGVIANGCHTSLRFTAAAPAQITMRFYTALTAGGGIQSPDYVVPVVDGVATYSGDCGLSSSPRVKSIVSTPLGYTAGGYVWTEIRASYNGVSAP